MGEFLDGVWFLKFLRRSMIEAHKVEQIINTPGNGGTLSCGQARNVKMQRWKFKIPSLSLRAY